MVIGKSHVNCEMLWYLCSWLAISAGVLSLPLTQLHLPGGFFSITKHWWSERFERKKGSEACWIGSAWRLVDLDFWVFQTWWWSICMFYSWEIYHGYVWVVPRKGRWNSVLNFYFVEKHCFKIVWNWTSRNGLETIKWIRVFFVLAL